LRLELAPFGVTVVTVLNGGVQSNGQAHFGGWKLPEGSVYKPIEAEIAQRARGEDGATRSDTTAHAKELVGKITGRNKGRVWAGSGAGGVRFATKWLSQNMVVSESEKRLARGTDDGRILLLRKERGWIHLWQSCKGRVELMAWSRSSSTRPAGTWSVDCCPLDPCQQLKESLKSGNWIPRSRVLLSSYLCHDTMLAQSTG